MICMRDKGTEAYISYVAICKETSTLIVTDTQTHTDKENGQIKNTPFKLWAQLRVKRPSLMYDKRQYTCSSERQRSRGHSNTANIFHLQINPHSLASSETENFEYHSFFFNLTVYITNSKNLSFISKTFEKG